MPGEYYNATSTPLDAAYHAGLIEPAHYDAGNRLRLLWHEAERAPRLTASLEPKVDGYRATEMSDHAAKAWRGLQRRLSGVSKIAASILYDTVLLGHPAEDWAKAHGLPAHHGVPALALALEALAEFETTGRRTRRW